MAKTNGAGKPKSPRKKDTVAIGKKAKLDVLNFHVKEERSNRWSLKLDYCAQIPKTSTVKNVTVTGSIVRAKDQSHRFVVRYMINGTTNKVMHRKTFEPKVSGHQVHSEAYHFMHVQAAVISHGALGNLIEVKPPAKPKSKKSLEATGRDIAGTLSRAPKRQRKLSNTDKMFAKAGGLA